MWWLVQILFFLALVLTGTTDGAKFKCEATMNFTQYIIMTRTLFIIIYPPKEQRTIHFYEKVLIEIVHKR